MVYSLLQGASVLVCAVVVLATWDRLLKLFGLSLFGGKKRHRN